MFTRNPRVLSCTLKCASAAMVAAVGFFIFPSFAQAAVCVSLPADAAHWWTGDGDAQDRVGTSHGTLMNGASTVPGFVNDAFSLDGIDDFVALAPGIDIERIVTVEAWVRLEEQESEEVKIYYHDGDRGEFALVVNADLTPGIAVKLTNHSWYEAISTAAPLTLGTWHHLAGSYDGVAGLLTIAVDGVVGETIAIPALPLFHIGGFPAAIGAYAQNAYGNATFFRGQVDEVTLYTRALTAQEIGALYQSGPAGKCAPGDEPPPENRAPALSFSPETGYLTDGVSPDKGTADLTPLTFKVIYTDPDNNPPAYVLISYDNGSGAVTTGLAADASEAVPSILNDGDYTNGEQYTYTQTFSKGEYHYHFEASDLEATARLPATGELSFQTGYSNVAFLPGHSASRLYVMGTCEIRPGVFVDCEKKLWEPGLDFVADVGDLKLKNDGTSENPDIYTKEGDVIDETFLYWPPLGNTYKKFIQSMDEFAHPSTGVINAWKPFAYDWRMPLETIVDEGMQLEGGGKMDLIAEIRQLAANSQSGKVTIVTHSNGGLLAKVLINRLEGTGEDGLIDRLIMVGAPQLGTPKGAAVLLHGDTLPGSSHVRELGENMLSLYNFLPSFKYFEVVTEPVVRFDQSVERIAALQPLAGTVIDSSLAFNSFITGNNGAWGEPPPSDTNTPNVLDPALLTRAITTHSTLLDNWEPRKNPDGTPKIAVTQIAGWGVETIRGQEYFCGKKCNGTLETLERKFIEFTEDGDGTVVLPSAVAMNTQKFYLNLDEHNRAGLLGLANRNREHSDILEVEELQDLIKQIVQNSVNPNSLPSFIGAQQPAPSSASRRLQLRGLSPISIDVYDSNGFHAGPVSVPESEVQYYEAQIPNSYYYTIDDETYFGMDTRDQYRIEINGLALGTFTLEIDEVFNDEVVDSTAYTNIPVTPTSKATLTTQTVDTTSSLSLDVQGDGTPDVTLNPSEEPEPEASLKTLKVVVGTMNIQKGVKNAIIKQIEAAEKALDKGLTKTADGILKGLVKQLQNYPKIIISPTDAQALIQIIETIRAMLV